MSNGIDKAPTGIIRDMEERPDYCFATGFNPFRNVDWASVTREAFGNLTGHIYTDLVADIETQIDRGTGVIRIATDGHTARVFTERPRDYLIGGTYQVPSGLGGVFRVILQDVTETYAMVRNCGNCEDFDAMQPYRVALDQLQELDGRRAA